MRPKRDALGRVTVPASVWLAPYPGARSSAPGPETVSVPKAWLRRRRLRELIDFIDARGARRSLRLVEHSGHRYRAEMGKTCYLTSGTRLVATLANGLEDMTAIGPVAPVEQRIRLASGDRIVVTARPDAGENARRDVDGNVLRPAHIACTEPEALKFVRRGQSIWFDDGRIGGVVQSATPDRLLVEVTHAPPLGAWLASDKGINLPDTALALPAVPPTDREYLRFIVRHADLVGFSFVRTASDLARTLSPGHRTHYA